MTMGVYAAAGNQIALAVAATDVFTLTGGANPAQICHVRITGAQTNSGLITVELLKRSAPDTGGTSTTPTAVPYDSTSPAATAVARAYTANPTAGALVGAVDATQLWLPTGAINTDSTGYSHEYDGTPIILHNGEVLAINLAGVTVVGGLLSCMIEWQE